MAPHTINVVIMTIIGMHVPLIICFRPYDTRSATHQTKY